MCFHVARRTPLKLDSAGNFVEEYRGGYWPLTPRHLEAEISAWLTRQTVMLKDRTIAPMKTSRNIVREVLFALRNSVPLLPPRAPALS